MAEVLLALDTSSPACTAALAIGDEVLERHEVAAREHARLILPMVESLLAEAGIGLNTVDALVMGRWPGTFTGVRIAVGVAQGLAFAARRPVVPVSSLAILAQEAIESGAEGVLAAFDARMGEVYWGLYRPDAGGVALLLGREAVSSPEQVALPAGGRWTGAGSGFAAYGDRMAGAGVVAVKPEALPRARYALPLGRRGWRAGAAVEAEQAQPVYLRDQVVQQGGR